MKFAAGVAGAALIAYSRLWRLGLDKDLADIAVPSIEIPHVGGIPVNIPLPEGTVRLAEWPNELGMLEPFDENTYVRWDRQLAPRPPTERIIETSSDPAPDDLPAMTTRMIRVCRTVEQIRGVRRAATPHAPITMLLTPGYTEPDLTEIRSTFPGTVSIPRSRLGEFPGGLQLLGTEKLYGRTSEFASLLGRAVGRETQS